MLQSFSSECARIFFRGSLTVHNRRCFRCNIEPLANFLIGERVGLTLKVNKLSAVIHLLNIEAISISLRSEVLTRMSATCPGIPATIDEKHLAALGFKPVRYFAH